MSWSGEVTGTARGTAKRVVLPEWTRVQHWAILFGSEEEVKPKTLRSKDTNLIEVRDVRLSELRRNRDGRYLYQKILHVAPENLFPPHHYYLQYRMPDAPFLVKMYLDNNEHVERAFEQFTVFRNSSLQDYIVLRLVAREAGAPLFNPISRKQYTAVSFRTRPNLARLTNELYLNDKLELKDMHRLLSLDTEALQREVYLMLPQPDKEDHVYLLYEKPKPAAKPDVLYLAGEITLRDYEELVLPEKRLDQKEVQPERPHICIVCRQPKAGVPCLQCERKICADCLERNFHSPEKSSFLLLHHAYCCHHGLPPATTCGGPSSYSSGHVVLPFI